MLILELGMVVSFYSCIKDPSDDVPNKNEYNVVGTWKYTFGSSSDYVLLTFNVNGTGRSVEFDDGEIDGDKSFRYSYAEDILTVFYDNGRKETVIINWKSTNKFITSWYDQVDTWIRQ